MSQSPPVTVRFAPSPNGFLHAGHAYSALKNWEFATKHGGQFLLRIEDIDTTRTRPEYIIGIYEDLSWLGFDWPQPVRIQSEHMNEYAKKAQRLRDMELLYPCFCSRKDIAYAASGVDPDGAPLYSGHCKTLSQAQRDKRIAQGEAHSWRLNMQATLTLVPDLFITCLHDLEHRMTHSIPADPARWGDVILVRKDIGCSYHLAVVTDDALQNITHVIRGKDLEAATDIHVLLQALWGLPSPVYFHHALLLDDAGSKLAKSAQSTPLYRLREEGMSARQWLHSMRQK